MNYLLLGYGKMGKAIEQIAVQQGHTIAHILTRANASSLATLDASTIDIALEFSHPQAAYHHIYQCLSKHIPVVAGTTGWLDRLPAIHDYCLAQNGTFLYAPNFSLGANLFFQLNAFLAQHMQPYPAYQVRVEEIHHTEKKDTPSGTSITLANAILQHSNQKKTWINAPTQQPDTLSILSQRIPAAIGQHTVIYTSDLDTLSIHHTTHSREAFAQGALHVAEWIKNKKGIFTMNDFLNQKDA